jgi:hypothetical protein
MNERIEKFARECGAWNQVYGNRTFMIDDHFDIEKFAELIVRECVDVVGKATASPNGYQAIMKHFGVEE